MYISYYQKNGAATARRTSRLIAFSLSIVLLLATITPIAGASTTRRLEANAEGSMGGGNPKVSENGIFVAFETNFDEVVPSDGNNASDVMMFDRSNDTTQLISLDAAGDQFTKTAI